jgi:uncharacterized protein (UPF0297 family)
MNNKNNWRNEIRKLSREELIDELLRPTNIWQEDVIRETLLRIYENLTKHNIRKIQSADVTSNQRSMNKNRY